MVGKIGERYTIGLLFMLSALVLAACNTTGGAELSVSNAETIEEKEPTVVNGATSVGMGGEAREDAEKEDGGEDEEPTAEPAIEATFAPEATAAPTIEVIPTATEEPPTATPEILEKDGIFLQDDRPEGLQVTTAGWNTNWEKHTVDYQELLSGGPPRDGIRSIDEPTFVTIDEAMTWLAGNEPVIALEIDGDARAYPLQILTWHEITNDIVGEIPVVVTFCPLCNSALVFDRRLEGETYEFGTSGLLRNSDLVMYDRTTESLWQQFTGEGIVGELAGEQLTFLPSSLVSFEDFREAFPEGSVLSQDTGFDRPYGINPYAGYDTYENPLSQGGNIVLLTKEQDRRLPAADRVVTVSLEDSAADIAYPLSILSELGVINDQLGEIDLVIFYSPGTSSALGSQIIPAGEDVGATGVFDPNLDGQKLTFNHNDGVIIDDQTFSIWNVLGQATSGTLAGKSLKTIVHGDHFWFSWAAFKPDTVIYEP